jgi:hypothetical protein
VVDPAEMHRWGWVFSLHDDPTDPSVGQAGGRDLCRRVIVDRFMGAAIEVGTDEPVDVQVRRYEGTGWPCAR